MEKPTPWIVEFLETFYDKNPPAMHATHALSAFIYAYLWSPDLSWGITF
jgi:hypothetical protein